MAYPMQLSFAGGELAQSLWGRVDLARYAVGARTLKNMIVHPQGGASNRAGTFYVGNNYSASKRSRLIPFVFSSKSGQAYCLEFSDYKIRVIQDGGFVESGGSPIEITSPYAEADLPNIVFEQSGDIMYLRHPDYFPRTLSRTSHTTWTLEEQAFGDGPYLSRTPENLDIIVTPAERSGTGIALSASDDLFTQYMIGRPFRIGYPDPDDATILKWGYGHIASVTDAKNATIDIADELFGYEYIYNPEFEYGLIGWEDESDATASITYYPSTTRVRLTHGSGGAAVLVQEIFSFTPRSYCELIINFALIDNSAQVRVYSTEDDGGSDTTIESNSFAHLDTGNQTISFLAPKDSLRLWIEISTSGSATGEKVDVNRANMSLADLSSIEWRSPAFTEDNGYPSCCGFYEQRLYEGGSSAYPQDVLGSEVADYNGHGFESPGTDSDCFRFSIPGRRVHEIRWLIDAGGLLIGTGGGVHLLAPGGDSDTVTPTSKKRTKQKAPGTADIQPLSVGNILYIKRGGNSVIEIGYQITADGFTGNDISVMAAHRFNGYQVEEWAVVENQETVVWAVRSDGKVLALTYLPEHEVRAWTYHDFGGDVESVCVVPGEEYDELYLSVKRTVNGSTVRYIERMLPRDIDDPHFVDCGLSYSGTATDTVSGLDHLEGETVVGTADGSVFSAVVSGGSITLDMEAEEIHVGLSFVSDLHTLPLMGSKYGRKSSVPVAYVYLENSRGGYAGKDEDNLIEFKLRSQDDEDEPTALVTDFIEVNLAGTYDTDNGVLIRNTDPIPITVLAVVPQVD